MTRYTEHQIALVQRLENLVHERELAEERVERMVKLCRANEMSWARIGIGLRTSGQAAWEKYGLTDTQKAERSLRNRTPALQDTFEGLEITRDQRVEARKVALKNKRAKRAQD